MSKGTFLLLTILAVMVLLIGGTLIDCCWFSLGENVVAKRNCHLYKIRLDIRKISAEKSKRACDFNVGETGTIAVDALG